MQIKHVCQSCGEVMQVCDDHKDWLSVKRCDRHRKALCATCASWPGVNQPIVTTPKHSVSSEGEVCNSTNVNSNES
jgi:hypothetical protein